MRSNTALLNFDETMNELSHESSPPCMDIYSLGISPYYRECVVLVCDDGPRDDKNMRQNYERRRGRKVLYDDEEVNL